jgi:hypothetical protein
MTDLLTHLPRRILHGIATRALVRSVTRGRPDRIWEVYLSTDAVEICREILSAARFGAGYQAHHAALPDQRHLTLTIVRVGEESERVAQMLDIEQTAREYWNSPRGQAHARGLSLTVRAA